jgi:hypothetical protein
MPASVLQPPTQDPELSLGSTDDGKLSRQEFVTKKVPARLAVYGAIPTNMCEVKNVFQVIEGSATLQPIEIDLVNIRECISPLASLVTAAPNDTQTADGFKRFL